MATFVNKIKHTVKTGTNRVKAVFNPVTKEDIKRHNYILEKLETGELEVDGEPVIVDNGDGTVTVKMIVKPR